MDTNIIVKTGVRGTGKTKWLQEKINSLTAKGIKCYMLTDSGIRFDSFCQSYINRFSKRCPLEMVKYPDDIQNNAAVFVDDMFCLFDELTINRLFYLAKTCRHIYITIDGRSSDNIINKEDEYEQLNIDWEKYDKGEGQC